MFLGVRRWFANSCAGPGKRAILTKQLTVPLSQVAGLKQFFRAIAGDERGTVVLKPVSR